MSPPVPAITPDGDLKNIGETMYTTPAVARDVSLRGLQSTISSTQSASHNFTFDNDCQKAWQAGADSSDVQAHFFV